MRVPMDGQTTGGPLAGDFTTVELNTVSVQFPPALAGGASANTTPVAVLNRHGGKQNRSTYLGSIGISRSFPTVKHGRTSNGLFLIKLVVDSSQTLADFWNS